MWPFHQKLNLESKISLVLVAVIIPTFLIVTIVENKVAKPILEQEILQTGISAGKRLSAEIDSSRMLTLSNPTPVVENSLQEILLTQNDIVRIDVIARDLTTGGSKWIATNFEDDPLLPPQFPLVDSVTTEFKEDENGQGLWDILVPIEHRGRDIRGPRKLLGTVHLVVSTHSVTQILGTLWATTAIAGLFSVLSLILALRYFLRKTIENDRKLRLAESHNLRLTEQLHEAERQAMIMEKFAVMGQLTASFAHEIGTPLNAIGGHLQLLKEEIRVSDRKKVEPRFEIVDGQLSKIENIVKGFLQSTARPESQKQLVDLNRLVEKSLSIVAPRCDLMDVQVRRYLAANLKPVRVASLDLEQVLLNLLNNSLDSIRSKMQKGNQSSMILEITTSFHQKGEQQWAQVTVYDTGEGIRKSDFGKVFKPFFTTKCPSEGTGLGLAICQQLVTKQGGELTVESKEGAWTQMIIKLMISS